MSRGEAADWARAVWVERFVFAALPRPTGGAERYGIDGQELEWTC